MTSKFYLAAFAAVALLAHGAAAQAQTLNSPGTAGTVITPGGSSTAAPSGTVGSGSGTAGSGSGGMASTPVTPSAPRASGLPGDNPSAPGFPGKVGR